MSTGANDAATPGIAQHDRLAQRSGPRRRAHDAMIWQGKAFGALLGVSVAGPVGALFGAALGHMLDMQAETRLQPGKSRPADAASIQDAFFRATFQIMGHLAKADGRISEEEIRAARSMMRAAMRRDGNVLPAGSATQRSNRSRRASSVSARASAFTAVPIGSEYRRCTRACSAGVSSGLPEWIAIRVATAANVAAVPE